MTVCERIDALLREKNMSRRQLAIKAGIAPSSLQSAMQRNTTISLDMLFPISEVLNVDVEFLDTGYSPDDPARKEMEKRFIEEDAEYAMEMIRAFENEESFLPIILNWEKLNRKGQQEAVRHVEIIAGNPIFQRTAPTKSLPEDEQGESSTTQEKPPEGQPDPKDGQ